MFKLNLPLAKSLMLVMCGLLYTQTGFAGEDMNAPLSQEDERISTLIIDHSGAPSVLLEQLGKLSEISPPDQNKEFWNIIRTAEDRLSRGGNAIDLFVFHHDLGKRFTLWNDYPNAVRYQKQALNSARDSGVDLAIALGVGELGINYMMTGRFELAHQSIREALETAEQMQDNYLKGIYSLRFGRLFSLIGDVPEYAIVYLTDAAELLKQADSPEQAASAELFLAATLLTTNNPDKTHEARDLSAPHLRSPNPTNQNLARLNMATIALLNSDIKEFIRLHTENIYFALDHRLPGDAAQSMFRLAQFSYQQGDIAKACTLWQEADNILRQAGFMTALQFTKKKLDEAQCPTSNSGS